MPILWLALGLNVMQERWWLKGWQLLWQLWTSAVILERSPNNQIRQWGLENPRQVGPSKSRKAKNAQWGLKEAICETAVKDLNILLISKQSNEASWKNQEEGEGGGGASPSKTLVESSLWVWRHVSLGWNSKWHSMGEVQEVDKNVEFRSDILPLFLGSLICGLYYIEESLFGTFRWPKYSKGR